MMKSAHHDTRSPSPGKKRKAKEKSDWRDKLIGMRMRERRIFLQLTQKELGTPLNVRPQQIQRYETGLSRLSAARLVSASRVLGVPIDYFYQDIIARPRGGYPGDRSARSTTASLAGNWLFSRESLKLVRNFRRIGTAEARTALLGLMRALAAHTRNHSNKSLTERS